MTFLKYENEFWNLDLAVNIEKKSWGYEIFFIGELTLQVKDQGKIKELEKILKEHSINF